jgi:HAD superfamily hydrolase (TIGR01509 family)
VLVVFDCDGVLVDSEPIANVCFARALASLGLDWSVEETMRRLMGRSVKSCVEIVEGAIGRGLPPGFLERLQADTFQAFRDAPLRPVPGVIAAIDAIEAAGITTCVASSGDLEKMRLTLGITGLWSRFEGRIFSATQVPRGKPFPDLFLHAAFSMNEQPFACTVVEDAEPGIRAARAAGMRALAYVGAAHTDGAALEAAGGHIFDDMVKLPALVAA